MIKIIPVGTLISTAFITELLKLSTEDIKELTQTHKPETWEEREQKIQIAFEDSPALEGALKMSKQGQVHREPDRTSSDPD